ncbi:hypothetical protein WA026_020927 [Henosepilachna vigintioctopunctata]|uniref:Uncharacterized protein n=1 Tax=Henosepilachna vigintioctopunctata TaxID=420089 RepID=A0AAW1UMW0_9CUCU
MQKFVISLLVLACFVSYGITLKCHTCTNGGSCLYGTTQKYDLKECESGQDRCFRAVFRRGDRWAPRDYERGCADKDFCRVEGNKQNTEYDVAKCELCDYDGCNSGSLSF